MAKLPVQRSLPGGCPNDETVAHRAESCGAIGRDLAKMEGLSSNRAQLCGALGRSLARGGVATTVHTCERVSMIIGHVAVGVSSAAIDPRERYAVLSQASLFSESPVGFILLTVP